VTAAAVAGSPAPRTRRSSRSRPQKARAALDEDPDLWSFSLSPNDGWGGWCECEDCIALDPPEFQRGYAPREGAPHAGSSRTRSLSCSRRLTPTAAWRSTHTRRPSSPRPTRRRTANVIDRGGPLRLGLRQVPPDHRPHLPAQRGLHPARGGLGERHRPDLRARVLHRPGAARATACPVSPRPTRSRRTSPGITSTTWSASTPRRSACGAQSA
jgi:hypothetical protein